MERTSSGGGADTQVSRKLSDLAQPAPKVAQLIKNVAQVWNHKMLLKFYFKIIFIGFRLFSTSWCETKAFSFY